MNICFLCVGKVKKAGVGEAAAEYLKRIKRYIGVEVIEVKDETASSRMPREDVLKGEGERLLSKTKPGDYIAVLADSGREMTSQGLSKHIEGLMNTGRKRLVFIVGGSYGIHENVYNRADIVLSLSRMTLPHDIARLVLYEQVYRAFTIIRNEPYSH